MNIQNSRQLVRQSDWNLKPKAASCHFCTRYIYTKGAPQTRSNPHLVAVAARLIHPCDHTVKPSQMIDPKGEFRHYHSHRLYNERHKVFMCMDCNDLRGTLPASLFHRFVITAQRRDVHTLRDFMRDRVNATVLHRAGKHVMNALNDVASAPAIGSPSLPGRLLFAFSKPEYAHDTTLARWYRNLWMLASPSNSPTSPAQVFEFTYYLDKIRSRQNHTRPRRVEQGALSKTEQNLVLMFRDRLRPCDLVKISSMFVTGGSVQ